ncbi:hypothetical protein K8I31_04840 [bacterium]|nr:hypothetical protein [bacterium]
MKRYRIIVLHLLIFAWATNAVFSEDTTLMQSFKRLGFDLTWKDEIRLKGPLQGLFAKTGQTVEIVPIAKSGSEDELENGAIRVGFYPASEQNELHWLFECGEPANGQSQIYGITSKPGGVYSFQPGSEPFGLYLQSKAFNEDFSLDGETVRTQNLANQLIARFGVDVIKARIFPYQINGQFKKDWFVVAWEASENNDYQDLILVIRGVRLIETQKPETERREHATGAQFT